MDTSKYPIGKLKTHQALLVLFAMTLVFSNGAYSNPSDVIFEFPISYDKGEGDSVITLDSVRNELSDDGEWIKVNQNEIDSESVTDGSTEFDDDINTQYVWRPNNVGENWSPYTNGYWTYTTCGWMWVSNYKWGWRPYHYGRWWWSPQWGWVWSPGFIWAPAWVVWMFYDGYCGWYPLSPRVRWHHHHHHHGYYCHHIRFRVRHWAFVSQGNFHGLTINHNVIIDSKQNADILKYSTFASDIDYENGRVFNKGPELKDIEKASDKTITAEDVERYNSTERVNKYVERISKEEQKFEKTTDDKRTHQERQENNKYNERSDQKEDKKYERKESTKENKSDERKQQENNYEKSDEKRNENIEKKENNNREQNNNNRNDDNNRKENQNQERKNENPPSNNEKRNDDKNKQDK